MTKSKKAQIDGQGMWVSVNFLKGEIHNRFFLTRASDSGKSADEYFARCQVSIEGDELWFEYGTERISVEEVWVGNNELKALVHPSALLSIPPTEEQKRC